MKVEELRPKLTLLAQKFVPKDSLLGIARFFLKVENIKTPRAKIRKDADRIVETILLKLEKNRVWKLQKTCLFDGKYPTNTNEFLNCGNFAIFGKTDYSKNNLTYEVKHVTHFSSPSPEQLLVMAPKLTKICKTSQGDTVRKSVDIDRFKILSASAVKESGLIIVDVLNRPTIGEKSGWELPDNDLPKNKIAPKIACTDFDLQIIEDFVRDLNAAAAWYSEDSLATYLACLIQPMLIHLKAGMFPAYMFRGPTKSGKGLFSKVLPDWLYNSNLERAVSQNKFPNSAYEMALSLKEAKDCLYYACDEVKDLKEEQLKIFDNAVTAPELTIRVMREGYFKIPNHLTFTMAAVYSNLTDETWGRIALIELTESRTEEFENFLRAWKDKAPELLAALYHKLNQNIENIKKHPVIENRRPGFGLIAEATELVFGIRPTFAITKTVNQILELICELEGDDEAGDSKGKRKRLSLKEIRHKYNDELGLNESVTDFFLKLKTALGTGNKRTYSSENGDNFKIVLNEEGADSRKFVYVQKTQ